MNADGSLDLDFNPNPNHNVEAMALLAENKILVGGRFTQIDGEERNRIARLHPDGTLDSDFAPDINGNVFVISVQPDGSILLGGSFTEVAGQPRERIARLHPDGSLDMQFNPGVNNAILSMALQADGRIWLGGSFTRLGGQVRSGIAAIDADGTLITDMFPNANSTVNALALHADGSILAGGSFTRIGGRPRNGLARLENHPAESDLTVTGGSQIDWQRGGSAPEFERVTFSYWDGAEEHLLGPALRVAGGWQITGLQLPQSAWVRGQGQNRGGAVNGSSGIIEEVLVLGENSFASLSLLHGETSLPVDGGAAFDFGVVTLGESMTATLTLQNASPVVLSNLSVSIDGQDAAAFSLQSPIPQSLCGGESISLVLEFTPANAQAASASLSITHSLSQTPDTGWLLAGSGNHAPTFDGFSGQTLFETAVSLSLESILAAAEDVDGDEVSVFNAGPDSAEGGSVLLQAASILYTPPGGFSGTDTFEVIIKDIHGASVEGTVFITVAEPGDDGGEIRLNLAVLAENQIGLVFLGTQGRTYLVQRSENLSESGWSTIATLVAGPTGEVLYEDQNPPGPIVFYRLALP